MIIAIDFDGTCVTHEFPATGKDIGAAEVLKELIEAGHKLILYTMRDNVWNNTGFSDEVPEIHNGEHLNNAVKWFKDNDIELYSINKNPDQHTWTGSPKVYAKLYIDDAALGCPLITDFSVSARPYADWKKIREMLVEMDILKKPKQLVPKYYPTICVIREKNEKKHIPFGAYWLVHCPWAHPAWDRYLFTMTDLTTEIPGSSVVLLKPGMTHQVLIYATNPDFDNEIPENPGLEYQFQLLQPANHGYQFVAKDDFEAMRRINDIISSIEQGKLSPDTDFVRTWDNLFKDGASMRVNTL